MKISVQRLPHGDGLPLPGRATEGSAGFDLRAAISEPIELPPGARQLIPTGFAFEIPDGWEGQVRPRSGLALKHGLTLPNSPGTIDSDYRGEVGVILLNAGQAPVTIKPHDRIAQMIVTPVQKVSWIEVEELATSSRGEGGFGSTGQG